ncbi:hypothetical protein ABIE00_000852 [Arthrobacter sp. OAP107]
MIREGVALGTTTSTVLVAVLVSCLSLLAIKRLGRQSWPLIVPGTATCLVALIYVFWPSLSDVIQIGSLEERVWFSADPNSGLAIFAVASVGLASGPLVVGRQRTLAAVVPKLADTIRPGFALAAGSLLIAFYIYIRGFDLLLDRENYLGAINVSAFAPLIGPLLLGAMVFSGLAFCSASGLRRLPAIALITVIVAVVTATGSRSLGLYPLILITVAAVMRGRVGKISLGIAVTLAFMGLNVALAARSLDRHGLLPYVDFLVSDPAIITDWERSTGAIRNIVSSVPLAGTVLEQGGFSLDNLRLSLDPFGAEAWSAVSDQLRIHAYVPYTAFGELALISFPALFLGCFLFTSGCAWIWKDLHTRGHHLWAIVALAILLLSYMQMLQYNLRSTTRLLYFILLLYLGVRAFALASGSRSNSRTMRRSSPPDKLEARLSVGRKRGAP